MSWVKIDCQTAARRRAAAAEAPMIFVKMCRKARRLWKKTAKVWAASGASRLETLKKDCHSR